MSQILLEFEKTFSKPEIIIDLTSSSKYEAGDSYDDSDLTNKTQTKVLGILSPLVMINNTVIKFDKIHFFHLKSTGVFPELVMVVEDVYDLITNIDKIGNDNEVRIQILPKFDNAYKKIDLTFFISNVKINGSLIRMSCVYKFSDLTSSQFVALGKLDTYSLFKDIATKTKMGFATNISVCNDKRYIYADNKSWINLMDDEVKYSNTEDHIIDYWIDFWDNINIVDLKERYEAVDPPDDLKMWISGVIGESTIDTEIEPLLVPAVLHNHPLNSNSELFVKNYEIINEPGSSTINGTDKLYSIYEENKGEYLDHLLQDGDIKKDIFMKYEYLGECYGDYNYILSKTIRNGFFQKVNSEKIKITLQSPLLGLMRGHRVNFIRYVDDDALEHKLQYLEEHNVLDRDVNSNIPLNEYELTNDSTDGKFRLDRSVSAQYLIYGIDIIFNNGVWDYVLTLVRPASGKPNMIKE